MLAKPELITRLKASVINGRVAYISMKAVVMEIGKPSDKMLICGEALEIRPVASEVRKRVPRMGRLIIMASRKRRESPERSMDTIVSLPLIRLITLID